MLTLEEQERLAYIQGDVAKAELLAALIDTLDPPPPKYEPSQEEGSTCD